VIGFVHIAKTAGSSVKYILRNSFGIGHCNLMTLDGSGTSKDADLAFAKKVHVGLRSISGHTLVHPTAQLSPPIQYFTFLRDPVTRFASHYQQWVRRRESTGKTSSFDEYIAAGRTWNRQVLAIAGGYDLELAKRELDRYFLVGLVEEFDDSVAAFGSLCPYSVDLRFLRRHVAVDKTEMKRVLADEGTRRQIVEANELDLELYAYAREVVFPANLKAAQLDASSPRAREVQESEFAPRYRLSRLFAQVVYRPLIKVQRRKLAGGGKKPAQESAEKSTTAESNSNEMSA
jgi:hypothetical protein